MLIERVFRRTSGDSFSIFLGYPFTIFSYFSQENFFSGRNLCGIHFVRILDSSKLNTKNYVVEISFLIFSVFFLPTFVIVCS